MLREFLLGTPWPGLMLWCSLYVSDMLLTIMGARLYRSGACDKIVLEGSYELNPYFQRDIDALRGWSPRFVAMLAVTCAWLWMAWTASAESDSGIYETCLGVLVSMELVVHIRHLRNLFLFRAARNELVRGRIEYTRDVILTASSLEIFTFAGLFTVVFAFTASPFVFGGAIGCVALAAQQLVLARRQKLQQRTTILSSRATQS